MQKDWILGRYLYQLVKSVHIQLFVILNGLLASDSTKEKRKKGMTESNFEMRNCFKRIE